MRRVPKARINPFPEAIEAVYPQAQIQTCIVHLIRNSTTLASWQERKGLAAALKPVYHAANADAAEAELDAFAAGAWGKKFPTVPAMWRRQWQQGHSVLRLPAGGSHDHLHHQCHRKPKYAATEDRQEPGPLPDRRGGDETTLPGIA
jgi:transposase-like protein